MLNLGDPQARQWLTDHVATMIKEQGIDLYRQDHNFDPLAIWRGADEPDRQGITENLHVQGYLAYWDELLRRYPDMLIDSCASGGRRNDLETLRRSVPLLRSDYQNPQQPGRADMQVGNQGHTFGLAQWVPYYGTGECVNDYYSFRSHLCPSMGIGWYGDKGPVDWALVRKGADEYRKIADLFWGDFYPLMPYTLSEDSWMAWQFNRPEKGDGMVQVFRHKESAFEAVRCRLCGLDPAARYRLTDMDTNQASEMTGQEMMTKGVRFNLEYCPGSAIATYRKLP
jgi:alpha-galactosidase